MKKVLKACPVCKGEGMIQISTFLKAEIIKRDKNPCTFCNGKGYYSFFIEEINPKDIKNIKLFNKLQQ